VKVFSVLSQKKGKKRKKSCSFLELESSFWRRLCQWTPTKLAWSKSIFHKSMVTTWGITQPSNQIWWCHVALLTKFMALTTLSIIAEPNSQAPKLKKGKHFIIDEKHQLYCIFLNVS
jgi:hypothetical protein